MIAFEFEPSLKKKLHTVESQRNYLAVGVFIADDDGAVSILFQKRRRVIYYFLPKSSRKSSFVAAFDMSSGLSEKLIMSQYGG